MASELLWSASRSKLACAARQNSACCRQREAWRTASGNSTRIGCHNGLAPANFVEVDQAGNRILVSTPNADNWLAKRPTAYAKPPSPRTGAESQATIVTDFIMWHPR